MNAPEDISFAGMSVTVEESADALTYHFRSRDNFARSNFPFSLLLPFVLFPLGLLALVGYAYSEAANRPEWELILTAIFAAQVILWLIVGTGEFLLMLRWWYRPYGTALKFTRTHVWHGHDRVCELEVIRGLRLLVFPVPNEVGKTEACLSLVIGEDSGTHGLLGGFPDEALRTFAHDLQRRLTAFRHNQGILSALESLSVVETTAEESGDLMHTRPAPHGGFRMFAGGFFALLQNRWAGSLWCLAMFAGLYGSGRLVASVLPTAFLIGHAFVGFMHVALLIAIWDQTSRKQKGEKSQ